MTKTTKFLKLCGITVLLVVMSAFAVGIFSGLRLVPVLTGSMRPVFDPGTLAATIPSNTDNVEVGEVIAFVPPAPWATTKNRPIMHRVIWVSHQDGTVLVRTQGDANPSPDPWTLDVHGARIQKEVFSVPYAGLPIMAFTEASTKIGIMSAAGIALFVISIFLWTPRRKIPATSNKAAQTI